MRHAPLLVLFFFCSRFSFSQDEGENPLPVVVDYPPSYYVAVDVQAEFPGGINALGKFLKDSMHYPKHEKDNCLQGKINVEFYVDTTGKVIYPKAKDFVPGAPGLQKEAVRLVSIMPKWKPAIEKGKKVTQQLTLTIEFQLKNCTVLEPEQKVAYDQTGVEEQPEFPGGSVALKKFFSKNIIDPQPAQSGRLLMKFIVKADGSISGAEIIGAIDGCSMCSVEAMRVAGLMPQWRPAKVNGKAVSCYYTIAVDF